jgi:hypothetical protein
MSITLAHAPTLLEFMLWGDPCQRIFDWAYALDEMVFREQLATGSFRGRWEIDQMTRLIMERINAQGQIAPYYGMGGSRGVCVYTFRPMLPSCRVRVHHTVAEEWTEHDLALETNTPDKEPEIYARFQILGSEYTTLRKWEHWVDSQAFSSRYTFLFGMVSMGRGYTVKVQDHQTNALLDATDYDSW